jgi:hypothetical protein
MGVIKKDPYFSLTGHIGFIFQATKRWWGSDVQFTKAELVEHSLRLSVGYMELFREWKESNHELGKTPMISKCYKKQPYTLENLQWTTFAETGLDQRKLMQSDMDKYLQDLNKADEFLKRKKQKQKEYKEERKRKNV